VVSCAKTAILIKMPFAPWAGFDPKNHVLAETPDSPRVGVILREKGRPIVKYRKYRPCAVAMRPFVELL